MAAKRRRQLGLSKAPLGKPSPGQHEPPFPPVQGPGPGEADFEAALKTWGGETVAPPGKKQEQEQEQEQEQKQVAALQEASALTAGWGEGGLPAPHPGSNRGVPDPRQLPTPRVNAATVEDGVERALRCHEYDAPCPAQDQWHRSAQRLRLHTWPQLQRALPAPHVAL